MENIYLVYGEDEYLVKHNINKIIKKHSDYNLIEYDLDNDSIIDVIDEVNTIGLFGNKIVVCRNCKFLGREKSSIEQNTDVLMSYLDNINKDAILVLSCKSIDNVKKIVKKLKSVSNITVCDKPDDNALFNMISKKFLNCNYKIDTKSINKIIELTHSDMNLINNEINKLMMYKLEEKAITINDVLDIVSEKLEDNIFELIDSVVDNDKQKIFSIYSKLINDLNYEPTKILIMIANQFRLMLKTKIMIQNKMSEKDIASTLGIHPYRVKLASQKSRNISIDKLRKYMLDLSEIDYNIKSGKSNKNASLELFFINL